MAIFIKDCEQKIVMKVLKHITYTIVKNKFIYFLKTKEEFLF